MLGGGKREKLESLSPGAGHLCRAMELTECQPQPPRPGHGQLGSWTSCTLNCGSTEERAAGGPKKNKEKEAREEEKEQAKTKRKSFKKNRREEMLV